MFENFFKMMLEKGVYFAPSMFEAGFISTKHTDHEIKYTIEKANEVFRYLKK